MVINLIIGILTLLGAGAGFVYFLVLFIQSYEVTSGSWGTEVTSNQDYMVAFFFFLMILFIGIYQIYATAKKKKSNIQMYTLECAIACFVSSLYGLARLIKCYTKGKPVETYYIWLSIALGCMVIFLIWNNIHLRLMVDKKALKNEEIPAKVEDLEEKPVENEAPVTEETVAESNPSEAEEDTYEPKVFEALPEPKRIYHVHLATGETYHFNTKAEAIACARRHSSSFRFESK